MISFVPPDGKFELFMYRVSRTNHIPIYVTPNISFSERAPSAELAENGLGVEGVGGGRVSGSGKCIGGADEGARLLAVEGAGDVGHLSVTIGARPTDGRVVEEVACRIPLPQSATSASLTATVGSVVHDTTKQEAPHSTPPTRDAGQLVHAARALLDESIAAPRHGMHSSA